MAWEYVALEWRTGEPKQDVTFRDERWEMLDRGWTEHLRAGWPQERMPRRLAGGICIMRKLKDELHKEETAGFEYVALSFCTQQPNWDKGFLVNRTQLLKEGWQRFVRAAWRFPKLKGPGGIGVYRREKPPKMVTDESRTWTKGEIQEIVRTTPVVTYATE